MSEIYSSASGSYSSYLSIQQNVTTENLYIEGDNLEVLKLLQETILEK